MAPDMTSQFEFDDEQVERARQMTPQQRVAEARRLTSEASAAQRKAIAEANPQLSEQEVNYLWMEQAYGKELTDRVRAYREQQENAQRVS
jgi:hypothetical protein